MRNTYSKRFDIKLLKMVIKCAIRHVYVLHDMMQEIIRLVHASSLPYIWCKKYCMQENILLARIRLGFYFLATCMHLVSSLLVAKDTYMITFDAAISFSISLARHNLHRVNTSQAINNTCK